MSPKRALTVLWLWLSLSSLAVIWLGWKVGLTFCLGWMAIDAVLALVRKEKDDAAA